eukprot:CAMPEP_0206267080 /NCGR_PEP_ID=MMETSP0047_2-20121206/30948_1 /ASSEMBLY_ACC=CAM_ASM_000192 /TAXON_ID=195065 /ORGANISM="Chroomonas mesostigmatica_cf, Strain CCMP1168" /LENGTH=35 /DNA_ID= /DNA_START= /DNA_END= /DNA_ORIENTATION=
MAREAFPCQSHLPSGALNAAAPRGGERDWAHMKLT